MILKHMKRSFFSFIIREIQIKTTLIYHLSPIRLEKIKNIITHLVGRLYTLHSYTLLVGMQIGIIFMEENFTKYI